jgi:hypothetical protein
MSEPTLYVINAVPETRARLMRLSRKGELRVIFGTSEEAKTNKHRAILVGVEKPTLMSTIKAMKLAKKIVDQSNLVKGSAILADQASEKKKKPSKFADRDLIVSASGQTILSLNDEDETLRQQILKFVGLFE